MNSDSGYPTQGSPCSAFNAAVPINAVFERSQLEERINVKGLWVLDQAGHLHCPWTRGQGTGILRRITFIHSELVIVVVVGDVFVARELFSRSTEGTLHRLDLVPACARIRGEMTSATRATPAAVAATAAIPDSAPRANRRRFRYRSFEVIEDDGMSEGSRISMVDLAGN